MVRRNTVPMNDNSLSSEQQSVDVSGPRVLIVDDEPRTLRVFRRVLSSTDAHCMVLEHASQAVTVLRSHPSIEVVVCDLRMPEIEGIELIRNIRAEFGDERVIQFIIVSGHVSMESAISAVRLQAVDFLFKPVMPRDLLAAVHKAMLKGRIERGDLAARVWHSDGDFDSDFAAPGNAPAIDRRIVTQAPAEARPAAADSTRPDHLPHYGEEYLSLRFLKRLHDTRARLLGDALLPDPAWSMLAELMRAALTGRRVAVTALCQSSRVPFTTALRRIDDLIKVGLVARMPDPSDRRRSYIELTDIGHQKMQRYLRNVAISLARA